MLNILNIMKRNLMLPMKIVQCYLFFSIVFYFFGPLKWPTHNPALLLIFLLTVQLALYLGYKCSINNIKKISIREPNIKNLPDLLKLSIILSLIFLTLLTIRYAAINIFSIKDAFESIKTGFSDPGAQYYAKFGLERVFGGKPFTYLAILLAPLWWSALPLSLIYFKKLTKPFKLLTIFVVLLTPLSDIATGTNKGVVDWLIIIATVLLIKRMHYIINNLSKMSKRIIKKGENKIIIVSLILIILGVFSFVNAINSRIGAIWDQTDLIKNYAPINFDSFLMRKSPSYLQPTWTYLGSYLNQGYFALSMAFTLPWTPTFGVGSSTFLRLNIFKETLGIDISPHTYEAKLESLYGWDSSVRWHSIYVRLANDIHFIGIIPLMFILGFFFAEIVKDAVVFEKPMAIVILCLLAIMFFYFPGNNQVMAQGFTFFTFWSLTVLWLLKRGLVLKKTISIN